MDNQEAGSVAAPVQAVVSRDRVVQLFCRIEFSNYVPSIGMACPDCGAYRRWADDYPPNGHKAGCFIGEVLYG